MQLIAPSELLDVSVSTAFDVQGQEYAVIVAKASWRIPASGQRAKPIAPSPLAKTDHCSGEPGLSALVYGYDMALSKPRCDIVFDSCAHAPEGKPVKELIAGFRVGSITKHLKVIGNRRWRKRLGFLTLSNPEPFSSMPLHYDRAYGGSLAYEGKKGIAMADTYLPNPVGCGWAGKHTVQQLDDTPAPNLEMPDDPVTSAKGNHQPVALGAIPPHWQVRSCFAGTMDEHWQRERFPFLPLDFDDRYHQMAPPDQQIDYPTGGEEVALINLLEGQPQVRFYLPPLNKMPIRVLYKSRRTSVLHPVVDTLHFETEKRVFSAIWRTRIPLKRSLQEIDIIAVGQIDPNWWRTQTVGEGSCIGCKPTPKKEVTA